ncbi:aldo/keto reductase [Glutamicibacter sp. PS]|uniref:aldo/keto reductase n=1 Tax=Glutamicibacter sp. PS TaxID=3075634 RepID=UPI002850906B|nr:aldo/keto reductase [Glutamicibacter sp. PS]MDR4532879.1 aldo/keto reductase [Glutamicibacter sp. PS]
MSAIPHVELANGCSVPAIGQGTWFMGERPDRQREEIATLRRGVELGLTLIDTATMYGDGLSEQLVGEAIAPVRDEVFLVDKVLPYEASYRGTIASCEGSLARLDTDHIDLLLLHWPGSHPVEETVRAFETLIERGLIGAWGVSNFDVDDLQELPATPLVNQVLYNPSRRGVEYDLLPTHAAASPAIRTMAYSPIEQGRLLTHPALQEVAEQVSATTAQVLVAWAIRSGEVIAIPKASRVEHVQLNAAAAELQLSTEQLAAIDDAFAPPQRKLPLQML